MKILTAILILITTGCASGQMTPKEAHKAERAAKQEAYRAKKASDAAKPTCNNATVMSWTSKNE